MIENGAWSRPAYRRFIVTMGDNHSIRQLASYARKELADDRSTASSNIETIEVIRPRYVHQRLHTVWATTAMCVYMTFQALMTPPRSHLHDIFPEVVVLNGPGIAFIVALVAHVLKILRQVPRGYMNIIYIESFARVSTLSLTGKLMKWTGVVDLFLVQHEELARRTGTIFAGNLVGRGGTNPTSPISSDTFTAHMEGAVLKI